MRSCMLRFINKYFVHTDERGSIEGLINQGHWQELNLVTSEAGVVRGNHYHQTTQELFIILEGEIEIQVQDINNGNLTGSPSTYRVKAGDVFLVEPMTNHIFIPQIFSKWINALSVRMDKDHPDFYRTECQHA